ncbi:riboflavin biosynthesis protein RibF [Candidatus Margulisiibacteriota bacterium]
MIRIFGFKKNRKIRTLGLGVFDGIHKAHQTIAERCDTLLTFFPHPDWFLGKDKGLKMLTTLREQRYYFDNLVVLHFTEKLSNMSAITFLEEIVYKRLQPEEIVIGSDYRFGYKAEGCQDLLKSWANDRGIKVYIVPENSIDNIPVKSSYIRDLLHKDEFSTALKFLGHSYLITGKVIRGEGRARDMGFPTSNLKVPSFKLIPQAGVYKGTALLQNSEYRALIYVGRKPTFGKREVGVEVHIHNFSGNIYRNHLNVFLETKIRHEIRFANQEELVQQIKKDMSFIL